MFWLGRFRTRGHRGVAIVGALGLVLATTAVVPVAVGAQEPVIGVISAVEVGGCDDEGFVPLVLTPEIIPEEATGSVLVQWFVDGEPFGSPGIAAPFAGTVPGNGAIHLIELVVVQPEGSTGGAVEVFVEQCEGDTVAVDITTLALGECDADGNVELSGVAEISPAEAADGAVVQLLIDGQPVGLPGPIGEFTASVPGDGAVHTVTIRVIEPEGALGGTETFDVETCTPSETLLCNGLAVTVNLADGEEPTEGDDVIRGTDGPDEINGLGGRDTICGLQGDDVIDAGDDFDRVFAGAGDDTVLGGAGNDILVGGVGSDMILGGIGNDRIQGGGDDDTLNGEGGGDVVRGGNGNDTLYGGIHEDELFGNLGRDRLFGEGGNDVLRGGAWRDSMDGGNGNDGCTLSDPSGNVEVRISCETGVFRR